MKNVAQLRDSYCSHLAHAPTRNHDSWERLSGGGIILTCLATSYSDWCSIIVMDSLLLHRTQLSGNICECPPIFGEGLLLSAQGCEVKVISLISGEVVGTFARHRSEVTSITKGSDSIDRKCGLVASSSKDGAIFVWRLANFEVLQEFSTYLTIYGLILPRKFLCRIDKALCGSETEKTQSSGEVYLVVKKSDSLEKDDTDEKGSKYKLIVYDHSIGKVRKKVSGLQLSRTYTQLSHAEGDYLVVANKRKVLAISCETRKGPKFVNDIGNITCIAWHQDKSTLLTGHERGEIALWHNVGEWIESSQRRGSGKEKRENVSFTTSPPVHTLLHWHAHAVRSLSFSTDGTYFFSGGEEAVLVMWQSATGVKSFVPRLGGSINFIESNELIEGMQVAVTTEDNTLHMVDASRMREEWSLRSLSLSSTHDEMFSYATKQDPVDGYLVCNGAPGKLQALDPYSRSIRWTHDVVEHTRVSRPEKFSEVFAPSVLYFDFLKTSHGPVYLSTIDSRRGEERDIVVSSLKFWLLDSRKSMYVLSAQVEIPHGDHAVTSLKFLPDRYQDSQMNYAVTTGEDGSVKLWGVALDEQRRAAWTCVYTFRHKDTAVSDMACSLDGSLLALAQNNVVSVWDPMTARMKASVSAATVDAISFVAFVEPKATRTAGAGSGRAFLVLGSPTCLGVYDLLSSEMKWQQTEKAFLKFAATSSENLCLQFASPDADIDDETKEPIYGYLAALDASGSLSILDLANGTELASFDLSTDNVADLCYGAHSFTTRDGYASNVSGLIITSVNGGVSFLGGASSRGHFEVEAEDMKAVVTPPKAVAKKLDVVGVPVSVATPSYEHEKELAFPDDEHILEANKRQASSVGPGGQAWLLETATAALPPVSALVDDFLGAHLRGAQSSLNKTDGTAVAQSVVANTSPYTPLLPGVATATTSSRHKDRSSLSGLGVDTDSSSEGTADDILMTEVEESRVNTKRRRSSSLASYSGLITAETVSGPALESFLEAHKVGNLAIFGKK